MRQSSLRKGIAYLLLLTVPWQSIAAAREETGQAGAQIAPRRASSEKLPAQDFKQLGQQAKSLGENQAASLKDQAGRVSNGTITVPTLQEGQFGTGDTTIHVDDLFPGTRRDHPDPDGTYFPKGQRPDLNKLKDLHDTDKGMDDTGKSAKKGLWKDAQGPSSSIVGNAYGVVLDASKRKKPDFDQDPMLKQSKETYEKIDDIAKWFGDCKAQDHYTKRERLTHIPEYHHCTRLYKPAGGCTIEHTIEIDTEPTDIVFLVDDSASMEPIIAALRDNVREFARLMTQGKANNLRIGGTALSRTGEQFHCDRQMENCQPDEWREYHNQTFWLNYSSAAFRNWVSDLHTARGATIPYEAVIWVAEHQAWRDNVHRVMVLIGNDDDGCCFPARPDSPGWHYPYCPSQWQVLETLRRQGIQLYIFHNNPAVKAIGTPLADIFSGPRLLKFAQFFTILKDRWLPQSCINDAIASLEEFCSGTYTAVPGDDNACVNIAGFEVCKGDPLYQKLNPPPLPNVPKQAARVAVSPLRCDYNHGKGTCWTDPQGKKRCLANDRDIDQCAALKRNPQCGYIASQCVQGAKGSRGNCYVQEDTYDCGKDINIPTWDKSTQYQCAGPIRCMGEDCLSVDQDQSADFARVAALLNAAQFMTQDMICEEKRGRNNLHCRAFKGNPGECKVAVGGIQNCCKNPQYPSLNDYLTLIMTVPKLDAAIIGIGDGSALAGVKGAYQVLRSPVLKGWTEVTQPFASYLENITGAFKSFTHSVTEVGREAVAKLTGEATKVTSKVIGHAATSVGAVPPIDAPQSMTEQLLGTQGAALFSTLSTLYTAYVVTMMMIKLIWPCEKAEFEMNAKKHLKSCTYLGSYCKTDFIGWCIEKRAAYCCFNSPLSRIIQEQVRPQLGMSFGDAEHPQCDGIPMERMSEVDWSQVNLDEWLGILQQNGHFPEPSKLTPEALTGNGSPFNTDGNRKEVIERTKQRLEGVKVDQLRKKAGKMVKPDVGAE